MSDQELLGKILMKCPYNCPYEDCMYKLLKKEEL